jgi:hypothetical protein
MKSIIYDTTFWRDILLIPISISALYLIATMKRSSINGLDLLVTLLAAYGLFHICVGGYDALEAGRAYRNHFLPILLYFAAKIVFAQRTNLLKLINFFFIIFLLYILDVFIELGLNKLDVSQLSIPWYNYMARVSDRYIGNETDAIGYIMPGEAGIIGLQGWQHATVAVLMVLFAFLLPLITYSSNVHKSFRIQSILLPIKYSCPMLCIIATAAAVLVFQVSMHIITFFVVMFLLFFQSDRKLTKVNSFIVIFLVLLSISVFVFQESPFFSRLVGNLIGHADRDDPTPTLETIIHSSQIAAFLLLDLVSFFTGLGASASVERLNIVYSENRLLIFGLQFGVIWLILILSIYLMAFKYGFALRARCSHSPLARNIVIGIMLALLVCLLDMSHYARAMYFPLIDIWAIFLGTLSAMWSSRSMINETL